MNLLSLKAFGVVSVVGFGLVAAAPCFAEGRQWIRVNQDVRLSELADDLNLSVETLAKLNELPANALLKKGKWVVLPKLDDRRLALSSYLDRRKASVTAPLIPPPSSSRTGLHRVTSADSLTSIATRYGVTLSDLRRWNPGINLARLVIGSELRVAKPAPSALLAIRPGLPGGASWPSLPRLPGRTYSGSYIPSGTSYQAPDTAQKQRLRAQLEQNRRAEQLAAARRAEAERVARQRRELALAQRYRRFGSCTYDWKSWGISPSGVRSVKVSCGLVNEVAVDCKRLKVSEKSWRSWGGWKTPTPGSQEDFVVEACANVLGAPKPDYSVPQPQNGSFPPPGCKPPMVLCGF